MEFKAGQQVRILGYQGTKIFSEYPGYNHDMHTHIGKVAKIEMVIHNGEYPTVYTLEGLPFIWLSDWLKPVTKITRGDF